MRLHLAHRNFRLAEDASEVVDKVCGEAYRLLCSSFILEDGNGGSHAFIRVEARKHHGVCDLPPRSYQIKLIPAYYCMHSYFLSLWLVGNQ
jgi:hypothetical protein